MPTILCIKISGHDLSEEETDYMRKKECIVLHKEKDSSLQFLAEESKKNHSLDLGVVVCAGLNLANGVDILRRITALNGRYSKLPCILYYLGEKSNEIEEFDVATEKESLFQFVDHVADAENRYNARMFTKKEWTQSQSGPDLPIEIMEKLFSYLCVEEILTCTFVCKRWNAIISGNNYVWMQPCLRKWGEYFCDNAEKYDGNWESLAKDGNRRSLAVIMCPICGWKVGGMRCRGCRNPAPAREWKVHDGDQYYDYKLTKETRDIEVPIQMISNCGRFLNPDFSCPSGCGSISNFHICHHQLDSSKKVTDQCVVLLADYEADNGIRYESLRYSKKIYDNSGKRIGIAEDGPLYTCNKCGWSVDGIQCCSVHSPMLLKRDGFFERVWCSYVWTCDRGCAREEKGGIFPIRFECNCGGSLLLTEYVECNGPPVN